MYGTPCIILIFINIFNINVHSPKIFRCLMCVLIINSSCNWYFRMSTSLCIMIFRITTGFVQNIFNFDRFLNFIIVLICWFCNILKIINAFFILSIRNDRSFYLFIYSSSICRIFSILLVYY